MKRRWREVTVGLLILAAAALLAYMSIRVGSLRAPGARDYVMFFDDVAGLVDNGPVAAAGITVGSVDSMEYVDGEAKVVVRVAKDVQVRTDAHATIRSRSLLGEKYIALYPGDAQETLPPGSVIPTRPSYDMDRLFSSLATLAQAVEPEDVRGIVHGLDELLNAETTDGQTFPQALADLTASLHRVSRRAEELTQEGTRVARQAGPTLDNVNEASRELIDTLNALQPSVKRFPGTAERLDRVLDRMDKLLVQAEDLNQDELIEQIRKIFHEEGVYVRLTKPRD